MAHRNGRKQRPAHYWKHDDNDRELGREHLDDLSEFFTGPELTIRDVRQLELATAGDAFRRRRLG